MRHDASGELTAIERLTLGLSDQPQRFSLRRVAEQFSRQRRTSIWHEVLCVARLVLQDRHCASPLTGNDRRDHKATLGGVNRGREQIGKRQLAVALREGHPARHSTRHGHGHPATLGHRLHALERVRRPRLRRSARRVEAVQRFVFRAPHQREQIAAKAVAARLDDGQHGGGGDDCVNRVAARFQHRDSRLRSKRMGGGHHIASHQRRSATGVGTGVVESHGESVVKMQISAIILRRR